MYASCHLLYIKGMRCYQVCVYPYSLAVIARICQKSVDSINGVFRSALASPKDLAYNDTVKERNIGGL
jgi:hypothetical protein